MWQGSEATGDCTSSKGCHRGYQGYSTTRTSQKSEGKMVKYQDWFKKRNGETHQHIASLFSRISTTFAVRSVILDQSASATSAQTPRCWPHPPGNKLAKLTLAFKLPPLSVSSTQCNYIFMFLWRWCWHANPHYRSGLCKLWSVPDCNLIRTLRGGRSFSSQHQSFT